MINYLSMVASCVGMGIIVAIMLDAIGRKKSYEWYLIPAVCYHLCLASACISIARILS